MKTKSATKSTARQTTVAQRIAGEDIRPGDYVTVLSEIVELPSFLWCCSDISLPADEPVKTRFLPTDAGEPVRVTAVCLPFIYAKNTDGTIETFDIRQQQLVKLDPQVGRAVWKKMRKRRKK
ncbi:MAG: hypothetical protein KDA87_23720 [Planctomycetales bacterium]|nr:hypothetical protein [Planctomycetales bacterium]